MNELVSIVIPVYNASGVIRETLDSVVSQTFRDWELILVDDGSTDKSVEIIEEYIRTHEDMPVRLVKNSSGRHGAAHARNTGIEHARGRYLAYIDADDLWVRDKLEKQLAFLREKKAGFTFTGYEFADEEGKGTGKIVRVPSEITYRQALKNTTIFTSTVLFDLERLSKELKDGGGLTAVKELIKMPPVESEDTACWWKILKSGIRAFGLDQSLTLYRRSRGTLSSSKLTAIRRIWGLYRRVEGLPFFYSLYCFCFWAVRAVLRRI